MPKSALTIVRPTVSVERGLFGLVTAHGTAVRYGIPPHPDYVSGLADGMPSCRRSAKKAKMANAVASDQ